MVRKLIYENDLQLSERRVKADLRSEIDELRNRLSNIETSLTGSRSGIAQWRAARRQVVGQQRVEDGKRLREIRKKLGWNQAGLAKHFGKTTTLICMMERGQRSAAALLEDIHKSQSIMTLLSDLARREAV